MPTLSRARSVVSKWVFGVLATVVLVPAAAGADAPATRPALSTVTAVEDAAAVEAERRTFRMQKRSRERWEREAGREAPKALTPEEQAQADADDAVVAAEAARVQADLRAKLDRRIPDRRFAGAELYDVIDHFRDETGLNIFVNWKALERIGVSHDLPVTLTFANNPMADEAMRQLFLHVGGDRVSIGWRIDEGVITISTGEDLLKNTLTRVYDVRDLIAAAAEEKGGIKREAAVTSIIRKVQGLAPLSFKEFGGPAGSLQELSGQFILTHTPEMHEKVRHLLMGMRLPAVPTTRPATRPG